MEQFFNRDQRVARGVEHLEPNAELVVPIFGDALQRNEGPRMRLSASSSDSLLLIVDFLSYSAVYRCSSRASHERLAPSRRMRLVAAHSIL